MLRVPIKPQLLRWAIDRSGHSTEALTDRFPKLVDWLDGQLQPTLKQVEAFARATATPVGFLFLDTPPVERVPIPDFRAAASRLVGGPSPDLLDTIYLCQQRQEWYREFAVSAHEPALAFVGSARLVDAVNETAQLMRTALGLDLDGRRLMPTWSDALRNLIAQTDALGVLTMVSGVVGSNNRRRLDPQEFRGFALADVMAPLIFVNGADTKAAQMFTVAHELAHIWLGESGVSDSEARFVPDQAVERWCNQVAAELLVPLDMLRGEFDASAHLVEEVQRLARRFKVSTLVILRRIHDAGGLDRDAMWDAYERELARLRPMAQGGGGDFYNTVGSRVGKRFARALIARTLEGQTTFTESFRLLGVKKVATFHELGRSLGVGL